MRIFVPKETQPNETRVSLLPQDAKTLVNLGAELEMEKGFAEGLGIGDGDYDKVGAKFTSDRNAGFKQAQMVLRMHKSSLDELALMPEGCIHVSYLDPFNEGDLVRAMAEKGISAVSLEMIPRTTIAQKMDVLSSQANLAGYIAVILAAAELPQVLPMMMTPAGTIKPARVFIIGVGVAGLQAIATAKRLGARVDAFDTRPVVEEQVKSLGAKFLKVDLGETGQTKDGYAKALTPEQLEKQRAAMAKQCALSDVVITTAQLFGRKAPVIVTKEVVQSMRPGSVLVDLAVESGGNIEGSEPGKTVDINGVKIIGTRNLPGQVPVHASQMFSANLKNFCEHFWDKEKGFQLNRSDEIIEGCLITHEKDIVNEMLKKIQSKG